MNVEHELMQKCPVYMAPFVSTIDLLKHAYKSYNIELTKEEFSNRLNALCFQSKESQGLIFMIPVNDDVYALRVNKFTIVQYAELQNDPNPLRINSSGISGGFGISHIEKVSNNNIENLRTVLKNLMCNFKQNTINDPIDDILDIENLSAEEFCRAYNTMTTLGSHVPIIRMCMRYISPIHNDNSDHLIFLDTDSIHSFQFYPSLLTGILLAADTNIFHTQSLSVSKYLLYIRGMLELNYRKLNTKEKSFVRSHAEGIDIDTLRILNLDTIDIVLSELIFYNS